VGKTIVADSDCGAAQKHPHERGEDDKVNRMYGSRQETPPRAWGRQHIVK